MKAYREGETDHLRAKNLTASGTRHGGSSLLWPEAASAIVRQLGRDRRLRDALLETVEAHLQGFALLAVDDRQLGSAVRLIRAHGLRAADALHVAAALSLAREVGSGTVRFVTADAEQAKAARAERLRVIEVRA